MRAQSYRPRQLKDHEYKYETCRNHNEEGQNVMFVDGHAEFTKRPIVGVNNDNIFTIQNSWDDPIDIAVGVKLEQGLGPTTNTDAIIIP